MKLLLFLATALTGLYFSVAAPAAATSNSAEPATETLTRGVAVVELFTSEGCSSCPAADRELERLIEESRQAGTPVYGLSWHVDYWNRLGWADPFSSPYFSARQTDYAERLGSRTYTPQMVVNGRTELVGSKRAELENAVTAALRQEAEVGLTATVAKAGSGARATWEVSYQLDRPVGAAKLVVALVQRHAETSVPRGENEGRTLSHANVVRTWARAVLDGNSTTGTLSIAAPADVPAADLEMIAFVQRDSDWAILGAVAR